MTNTLHSGTMIYRPVPDPPEGLRLGETVLAHQQAPDAVAGHPTGHPTDGGSVRRAPGYRLRGQNQDLPTRPERGRCT